MEDDKGESRTDSPSSEDSPPVDNQSEDSSSPVDDPPEGQSPPVDGSPGKQSPPGDDAPPANDGARGQSPPGVADTEDDAPTKTTTATDPPPDPKEHPIAWYLNSENSVVIASRDILVTVAMVALIGIVLFAITGVWPPLVAVESGSMEPNMKQGDLVLIVDNERFAHPDAHEDTGVLTGEVGEEIGHESFGQPGNVIVFQGDGQDGTPIIHRAEHHVEADENWYDRANGDSIGSYANCDEMPRGACPAPHDGFITQGDANDDYDQLEGQSVVVREEWIQGKAVARVPYLGCIRLELTSDNTCLDGRN